jgi:hypothetical protein
MFVRRRPTSLSANAQAGALLVPRRFELLLALSHAAEIERDHSHHGLSPGAAEGCSTEVDGANLDQLCVHNDVIPHVLCGNQMDELRTRDVWALSKNG